MKTAEIVERLPDVFKQGAEGDDVLGALLGVMELLHAPDEEVLATFDRYLDVRRAPDSFIPYLSWWLDLAWLFIDPPDDPYAQPGRPFVGGIGALRELAAAAARESKWRGTADGLVRMLETATGVVGFEVEQTITDEAGHPVPFTIRVHVPPEAEPFLGLVTRIIEHEKPAHVTPLIALKPAAAAPEPATPAETGV